MPDADTARVRCAACGANNFPSAPACWQCRRPLSAASSPPPSVGAPSPAAVALPSNFPARPARLPASLANQAAAALGLLFPLVGLPVGIVFLMLEDPRKAQLGWSTILWSVVGSVLSLLFLFLSLIPFLPALKGIVSSGGHLPGLGGGGKSVPGLGDGTQCAGFRLPVRLPPLL